MDSYLVVEDLRSSEGRDPHVVLEPSFKGCPFNIPLSFDVIKSGRYFVCVSTLIYILSK